MYKILHSILFLFCFTGFAQVYNDIDKKVKSYPQFNSFNELGIQLQKDFSTNEDRVRAAFIWVTHNIKYHEAPLDRFEPREKVVSYSKLGRDYHIRKNQLKRISRSFTKRQGVCYDYSLLLNELFAKFELESKIIFGISKTDIKDISNELLYKNHTWNAVKIGGEWQLMDPTWAAGYIDGISSQFVMYFRKHFYFTEPKELIKSHFPAETKWQLSENPITISDFLSNPLYYPNYFEHDIVLSPKTNGIVTLSSNKEIRFRFNQLPVDKSLFYSFDRTHSLKKIRLKRSDDNGFVGIIKPIKKNLETSDYLTLYIERQPVLDFKISTK